MVRSWIAGLIALVSFCAAAGWADDVRSALPLDKSWGVNPLWGDGQAEIALYEAEQVIYGGARSFEAVFLTVKETLNGKLVVKADDPASTESPVDAIKLNMIMRIPTPNYDYSFLACVQNRADGLDRLMRQTLSSQEWCGNVYKEFSTAGGSHFKWASYWESEGTGQRDVAITGSRLTEEQLFTALRSLDFAEGLEFEVRLYPVQFSNRVPKLDSNETRFTVSEGEPFKLAGEMIDAWAVRGEQDGGRVLNYRIGRAFPNPLLEFEDSTGRRFTLKSLTRGKYWERGPETP